MNLLYKRLRRLILLIVLLLTLATCVKIITVGHLDLDISYEDIHIQISFGND